MYTVTLWRCCLWFHCS